MDHYLIRWCHSVSCSGSHSRGAGLQPLGCAGLRDGGDGHLHPWVLRHPANDVAGLNTASTAEKKMTITLEPYHPDYLELISGWRKDPVVRLYNPVDDLSPEALPRRFSSAA